MEYGNSNRKQYRGRHDGVGSDVRYMAIFLYPIWKYIRKYLKYNDIFNLSSINMYARMSIYSLCINLRLDNPTSFREPRVDDFESPEFIINQFTRIRSLRITSNIMKFDFLKNKNLNNLRYFSLPSTYFSVARQYLPESLREIQIYKFGIPDESHEVVFDNTEAFKHLRKIYIISVPVSEKSLTCLPESLEYFSITLPNIFEIPDYNFNISHLVHLKELHCFLINCYTITFPSNLEKMYLWGLSKIKDNILNISHLNNLKILKLWDIDIKDIILPPSLEEIEISSCSFLTKLNIPELINLKQIDCNNNERLSEIYLPKNNLENFVLSSCGAIKKLELSRLINLKTLELNHMVELESLTLPRSLKDIVIKKCNIPIINEKEISLDLETPRTKLYSHIIKIGEKWELLDYKVTP